MFDLGIRYLFVQTNDPRFALAFVGGTDCKWRWMNCWPDGSFTIGRKLVVS